VPAGRGRLAHRGPRARRRPVRRGVRRGRHPGRRARARPGPLGPGPRRHRGDRRRHRPHPRRHLRHVPELRRRHPQGAPEGAAPGGAVRQVQERGSRPAVSTRPRLRDATAVPAAGATTPDGERPRPRWALLLGVAAVALALDQATKAWAVAALGDGHVVELVGSLRLRYVANHGSAVSLADGRGPLLSLLAIIVVAVLLRTGRHAPRPAVASALRLALPGGPGTLTGRHATRPVVAVALGMVLGGALGNVIGRAVREGDGFLGGGVVDFVDLQWWPVFNLADSAIVVGAALLFGAQWRDAGAPAATADRDADPGPPPDGPGAGSGDDADR